MELDAATAERLAGIVLGHVGREYPSVILHAMDGRMDAGTPRSLHPVFYGSLDWHSCVHGFWLLARVLALFPEGACAGAIAALFAERLTGDAVAGECAYFDRALSRGFERPYGWAWLLKLECALRDLTPQPWASVLRPLAGRIVARFTQFLPIAQYPVRVGAHPNTAFAVALAVEHARSSGDDGFESLLVATASRWYRADVACQVWEPCGEDFLSAALIEAECMRRVLPGDAFAAWFGRFLPVLPECLLVPVLVSDRSDGKIAHLDGVNLSRAWCWRSLATAVAGDVRARMLGAAEVHLAAAWPYLAADYMGAHWLASYALLALDGPYPPPPGVATARMSPG